LGFGVMRSETRQKLGNLAKIVVVLLMLGVVFSFYRHSMYIRFFEYRHIDTDDDTIVNPLDADIDGDGIPNMEDTDADGNGASNVDQFIANAQAFANVKLQYDPFGGHLGDLSRQLFFFYNVDAVLIPLEKSGIYLNLETGAGNEVLTTRDLHDFIAARHGFYRTMGQFDLPTVGDVAFFGDDFCALVVAAENVTVQLIVCEKSLGSAFTTLQTLKNSGYKLTEYGILFPE